MTKGTIIYVNFAPYENTGNIRDYLLKRYETVIIFLFNFHKLTNLDQPSRLTIYQKRKPQYQTRLFQTPTIPAIAFVSLPIRSIVIFFQIIFHTIILNLKGYACNDFFTVNAFIAWTGIVLKKMNLVRRTIFWVWDYYPPEHRDKMIMFMRWMYWHFDKPACNSVDKVIFLNDRMVQIRKKLGVLPKKIVPLIMPIGTHTLSAGTKKNKHALVFLGVVKESQGLNLFFDSLPYLKNLSRRLSLHIIGGGPDEAKIRKQAKASDITIRFYGYESSDQRVDAILSRCGIGIATYVPDPSNVSYWGDPSKIKWYLSAGLPVVTTNVFEFSRQISLSKCGMVIPYDPTSFAKALEHIIRHYYRFSASARAISRKYHYPKVYERMFD